MTSPFVLPNGRGIRILLFGEEGSGKTELAVGVSRMTQRFLYIDNEGSTTAHMLHLYSKEEPWGLRLLSHTESAQVIAILDSELRSVAKGEHTWDAIVLDGLTEQQINRSKSIAAEQAKGNPKEDPNVLSQRGWGLLLSDHIDLVQRCVELGNHGALLIVTAGAEVDAGEVKPLLRGAFAGIVGRYFDLVIYVKTEAVDGEPKHVYHLLKSGLFRGKNRYEDVWLKYKYPSRLVNATLEDLLHYIQEAAQKKAEQTSVK